MSMTVILESNESIKLKKSRSSVEDFLLEILKLSAVTKEKSFKLKNQLSGWFILVGNAGFEPTTSTL